MSQGSKINVLSSNLDVIVNAEQVVRGAVQAQQRNQEQDPGQGPEKRKQIGSSENFETAIYLLAFYSSRKNLLHN